MRPTLLAALCLASVASAQSSIFPTKEELATARRFEKNTVNEESRKFLKLKMKNHGKEMKDLAVAVSSLNFKETARAAQLMANQPRLDRAAAAATKLPEGFFAMQDMLKRAAQGIADSAKAQNVDQMVDQFQFTVAICAACHGVFREHLPVPGAPAPAGTGAAAPAPAPAGGAAAPAPAPAGGAAAPAPAPAGGAAAPAPAPAGAAAAPAPAGKAGAPPAPAPAPKK